ncbi:unnamed protein product [Blepharisma stoltei]|uniref:Protein kinase domain-containing protein n=1 Tax=Blepharisma stoltei TaxID=1481888 RepID=A0AAU9J949_9CILI|nr:unnamed protein product [Blepharisma stoltei]
MKRYRQNEIRLKESFSGESSEIKKASILMPVIKKHTSASLKHRISQNPVCKTNRLEMDSPKYYTNKLRILNKFEKEDQKLQVTGQGKLYFPHALTHDYISSRKITYERLHKMNTEPPKVPKILNKSKQRDYSKSTSPIQPEAYKINLIMPKYKLNSERRRRENSNKTPTLPPIMKSKSDYSPARVNTEEISKNENSCTNFEEEKLDATPEPSDLTKFDSPAAVWKIIEPHSGESWGSELSIKYSSSIVGLSSTHRQLSREEMLEEMLLTSCVAKYHEFKFKVISKDPLYEGVNGIIRSWKAGDCIGNGNFGCVLKAFDNETGELFAVKRIFFNPENTPQAQFINAYKNEINILKDLDHKHIVRYYGSEAVADSFCIYLEYLPGGSISSLLFNVGALPESTVKVYTKQILKGLIYLHDNNVIHRDIKGANLLLDSRGKIRLSDFGCSVKYDNSDESGLVNSLKGSLPWMAPEVVRQNGYGRKADIWSLGCVLIEMLTAKQPWPQMENHVLLMLKIATSNDIPEIPQDISNDAKSFISLCLQRDPEMRKSAKELRNHPFVSKLYIN